MSDQQQRNDLLTSIKQTLQSPAGEELLKELEQTWHPLILLGATPEETAYKVGLRDAFVFLQSLRNGDMIQ